MAEDQYIGRLGFEQLMSIAVELMQLAEDMANQYPLAVDLFEAFCRISSKPVVVAFDGKDRGNGFQTVDDFQLTDVTRMNDAVNPGEDFVYCFIVQAMRV